jgi:hypothetical protein
MSLFVCTEFLSFCDIKYMLISITLQTGKLILNYLGRWKI